MEFFNEDYEENYYDDDDVEQYVEADPLEISASQRVPQQEVTQAGDVSVHTRTPVASGRKRPRGRDKGGHGHLFSITAGYYEW